MNLFTNFEFADDDNDDTKINQARIYFDIDSKFAFSLRSIHYSVFVSHLFICQEFSK